MMEIEGRGAPLSLRLARTGVAERPWIATAREVAARLRRRKPLSPRIGWEAMLAVLVVLLAARFTVSHFGSTLVHTPASLAKLCEGVGEIPFQYRALVPWIVDTLHQHVPPISFVDSRIAIAGVLEAASVVGLYYALRALLRPVARTKALAGLAALALFHVLPYQYLFPENWPYWYPTDLSSVLFFTLGLLCIQRGRWFVYYPLFLLATFNRETTFFLTVAFALTQLGRMPHARLGLHVAAQGAIWVSVKLLLDQAYGHNGGVGGYYANAFAENLAMLAQPQNHLLLASSFGFLWIPLVLFGRKVEDVFTRRVLLVLIPYFAVALKLAVFDELRIMGEMIPIVLLGCTAIAVRWLDDLVEPANEPGRLAEIPARARARATTGPTVAPS